MPGGGPTVGEISAVFGGRLAVTFRVGPIQGCSPTFPLTWIRAIRTQERITVCDSGALIRRAIAGGGLFVSPVSVEQNLGCLVTLTGSVEVVSFLGRQTPYFGFWFAGIDAVSRITG